VTKTIGDNYRIYSLIIILNAAIVANVRCGLFKMSNMRHLTMFLPSCATFLECPNHTLYSTFQMTQTQIE
jgi:hypothetical protein